MPNQEQDQEQEQEIPPNPPQAGGGTPPPKPRALPPVAEAYVAGVRACTRAWAWPGTRRRSCPELTALEFALDAYAPPTAEDQLAWLRRFAEAFARAKGGPSEVEFYSHLAPRGFLRWLNAGLPDSPIPLVARSAPTAAQPGPDPDDGGDEPVSFAGVGRQLAALQAVGS